MLPCTVSAVALICPFSRGISRWMRVWSCCWGIWSVTFASFVVVVDAFCSPSACSRERRGQDPGQLFGDPLRLTTHFVVSCDHLQSQRIARTSHGCCWPVLGICSFCPSCFAVLFLFCSLLSFSSLCSSSSVWLALSFSLYVLTCTSSLLLLLDICSNSRIRWVSVWREM